MKKLALLTAVLALAACGGGSGGGSGGGGTRAAVTSEAIASNSAITSMVSEILIATDGVSPNVDRSATGKVNHGRKEYTSYRLNDVDFKMLDGGETESFTLSIDNDGKVDGIIFREATRNRINDTNGFEFVETMGEVGDQELVEGTLTYESYGKQIGLKYSDFGILRFNSEQPGFEAEEIMAYAGGYDVKKIDKSELSADATFSGLAKGSVGNDGLILTDDNAAQLVFNKATGSETLSASFDNWYDVSIVKDGNGITFGLSGNYTGEYELTTPTANLQQGGEMGDNEIIGFETSYYGKKTNPAEAVALFDYSQSPTSGEETNYTHVSIGFGGKAQ